MKNYDNIALAKKEKVSFSWKDLFKAYWFLLGTHKWKWLTLAILLFVISFYSLIPPLILGKMVDLFTASSSHIEFTKYIFLALVLGISYVFISFARLTVKFYLGNIQRKVSYNTKVKGFEKLLDFSYSWHSNEGAGAKAQRIQSGVEAHKTLNSRLNNEVMRLVAKIVGIIIVFVFLEPLYIIFFVLYAIGFWSVLLFFQKRIEEKNDLYYRSLEHAGGTYVEGLNNILTIKTLGAGMDFKEHIATRENTTKEFDDSIGKLHNNLWKSHQALNGVCYGIFLLLVGRDVLAGTISAGYLVVFYGYLNDLISSSSDMIDAYQKILDSKSGLGRMMGIFWVKHKDVKGAKKFPETWGSIEVNNAKFTYNNTSDEMPGGVSEGTGTVRNISFSIARGEKIGVVGKTGSGKSTLAKILTGLYRLDSGAYTVGGVPFDEISHDEQTRELTLVLQESEIFNLTLRENIALMKKLPDEVILNALRIAQLTDVVAKLPQGLETLVGEKGYHLSGGERQRVGIARAICKNASILIFDEATSSLDSKTEYLIQEALDSELKEKTIITIAHRVSTLQNTDRIFVFDNGEIVEVGTYQELSNNKKSKFYELSSKQQQ